MFQFVLWGLVLVVKRGLYQVFFWLSSARLHHKKINWLKMAMNREIFAIKLQIFHKMNEITKFWMKIDCGYMICANVIFSIQYVDEC